MSKCDIHIAFDQADRKFRSGDMVTGKVIVGVNKDVTCRGVVVSGYWKTHGRGNRDQGEYDEKNVFSGEMRAGESYEFPFNVTAPSGPLTYRGKLINIDHYVRVRVDIPWAIDPKQEDEFFLLPGSAEAKQTPLSSAEQASSQPASKLFGYVVMAVIFFTAFFIFLPRGGIGIAFLVIGVVVLAGLAFRALRNSMAERRLGKVGFSLGNTTVTPGQSIPVTIGFTPTKRSSIRSVTAALSGTEYAVSGSGTDKTTHRHTIHEQKLTLDGPTEFGAHKPVEYSGAIQLPDTYAYSFDTGENKVAWTVDLRIDIPLWPDWVKSIPLRVVPAEHLDGAAANVAQSEVLDAKVVSVTQAIAETMPPVPSAKQPPAVSLSESQSPVIPLATATSPTLLEAIGLLSKLDRYSDDHERILRAIKTDTFDISVVVERTVTSYERFEDSAYDGGKTISGVIAGTDHAVQINMPHSANDQVSRLHAGDIWQGRGRVSEWDGLYGRLEILGQD